MYGLVKDKKNLHCEFYEIVHDIFLASIQFAEVF